eukprot:1138559-Pelagomonas_calceolata.AAC.1
MRVGKHKLRNIARFNLQAQTLKLRHHCGRSTHLNVTDVTKEDSKMKNMPCSMNTSCGPMCSHRTFAHLFPDFPSYHRTFLNESGAFYHTQASSEDVFHFLQKQTDGTQQFISKLIDFLCGWNSRAGQAPSLLQLSRPSRKA